MKAIYLALPVAMLAMMDAVEAGTTAARMGVGLVITGGTTIKGDAQPSSSDPAGTTTYTTGAAAISVSTAGYGSVAYQGQSGGLYWFMAERDGSQVLVGVSPSTGEITTVTPG